MPVRPEQIKLRRRDAFPRRRRKRRYWFRGVLVALVFVGGYWGYHWLTSQPRILPQKMVILGFEGADLRFIRQYWTDLPNLQRLAEMGFMGTLAAVFPPESAVTWSSFAVGAGPGVHGIFGSLGRSWGTYLLSTDCFLSREDPKFLKSTFVTERPRFALTRSGDAVWDVVSRHKIPTTLIQVPLTFPAPQTRFTTCLSGSCPADISGNRVTFHHFSTRYKGEIAETSMGGKLVPLSWEGGWYRGTVTGPLDLAVKDEIKRLKDRLFALQLRQMEAELLLWLRDRTSPSILSDRERYRLALARMAADLRSESPDLRANHLASVESLLAILANPESPEAKALFAAAARTSETSVRKTLDRYKREEETLLQQRRALEERRGLPPPLTTVIAFQPADENSVKVDFGGRQDVIYVRRWSPWFGITFRVAPFLRVHSVTRFYLQSASPELEVYMQPLQLDPRRPPAPISHPAGFASQLVNSGTPEMGIFPTSGWAAETHGLIDEKIDEKAFMEDLIESARVREAITFYAYQETRPSLFISIFSSTDRVAHVLYRLIDPDHPGYDLDLAADSRDAIKRIYMRMDEVVGRMLDIIDASTVLFVVSGHGFCPFRHTVNLNTWLVEQGYMTLRQDRSNTGVIQRREAGQLFSEEVDWSRTKAYSLGPGQIYINLRGREPEGIVDPSDYDDICDEIRARLLTLTDTREGHQGERVIRKVGLRKEIWEGPFTGETSDAPDIQVGFEEGYHVSWQASLGHISRYVIEDNTGKWSGDHSCVSPDLVPGVLFCNRPINAATPSLVDLAPTVLDYFGLPGGKNLLQLTHVASRPSR